MGLVALWQASSTPTTPHCTHLPDQSERTPTSPRPRLPLRPLPPLPCRGSTWSQYYFSHMQDRRADVQHIFSSREHRHGVQTASANLQHHLWVAVRLLG